MEKDLIDASKALLKMVKTYAGIKDNEEADNFNDERKIRKSLNKKNTKPVK